MSVFKILTTVVRPVLFAITPRDHSAALVNPVSLEMDTTAQVHLSAGGGPSLEHIQSRTQSPQAPWSAVWSPGETLGKWIFFNFFDWLFG